jgi:hypothetical protein
MPLPCICSCPVTPCAALPSPLQCAADTTKVYKSPKDLKCYESRDTACTSNGTAMLVACRSGAGPLGAQLMVRRRRRGWGGGGEAVHVFGVVVYLTKSGKVAVRADFRRRSRRTLAIAFTIMPVECGCCYMANKRIVRCRAAAVVPQ